MTHDVRPNRPVRTRFGGYLQYGAWTAVLVWVLLLARTGSQSSIFFWETVGVAMLFATSTNLLLGYANMPSFGQAAFYGVGAYTVAEISSRVPVSVAILLALLAGAAAAFLVGLIAVRTRATAFSMITLAAGQGLYLLAYQSSLVGGETGISNILPIGFSFTGFWIFLAAVVAVALLGYRALTRTAFGVVLTGIRDDQKRAEFLGVPVFWRRLAAFVLAGAGAGLAGGLMAYANGIATPDMMYWTQAGYPIIMAIIGGMRSFWGPAVGAVLLTWMLQTIGQATPAYLLPVGAVLLLVLILAPDGLVSLLRRIVGRVGLVSDPGD